MARVYGMHDQWSGYVEGESRYARSFCVPDDIWDRYLKAELFFELALIEISEIEAEALKRKREGGE